MTIFFKNLSNARVKIFKYQQKDLITRIISVKYESSRSRYSNVINKVNVFNKIGQTLRSKSHDKICWTCH